MKWTSILLFFLGWSFVSCQSSSQNDTNTEQFIREVVSVDRFKKLMAEYPDAQIIDVRTPEEFAAGHLDGAQNINFYDDDFEEQLKKLDKKKTVLVYCKSGGRSGKASNKMLSMEFNRVYDLEGGYTAWSTR